MKLLLILLFSVFTPLLVSAEVHCSMVLQDSDCPPSALSCINIDAILGEEPTPVQEENSESIDQ